MVGYAVKNVHLIDKKHICPQCQFILREPCQSTICAHRLCQSCVEEQKKDVIICPICNEQIAKDKLKLDRGCKNDMKSLNITCVLCDWNGIIKDYQLHLDQEHLKPKCDYCKKQSLNVNDLIYHQQFYCDQIIVDCFLLSFGCQDKIARKDLFKHLMSEEHQLAIIYFIKHCYSKVTNHSNEHIREGIKKISNLFPKVDKLNSNTQQIRSKSNEIHSRYLLIKENFERIQQLNNEQDKFVEDFTKKQDEMWKIVLNLKDKPKQLNSRANEGIYIMKIDNVNERLVAAQSGNEPYIESPIFYSSPTGYNIRLRVYLNGDDDAQNTHISIHFIVLRGEYDAILAFPFCYKIVFCLYNQIDNHKHHIHRFLPNFRLENFQRPQTDMNKPYPISQFAPLELLQQNENSFIHDNTMFIKTFIDFRDTPDDLLEQVTSINPMYPSTIQQQIISK